MYTYIHMYRLQSYSGGGSSGGRVASMLVYYKVICIKAGSEGCLPVTGQKRELNTIHVAGLDLEIWTQAFRNCAGQTEQRADAESHGMTHCDGRRHKEPRAPSCGPYLFSFPSFLHHCQRVEARETLLYVTWGFGTGGR